MGFWARLWINLRYGTWHAVKGHKHWYAQKFVFGVFPTRDIEGPMPKREAEGIAALNNDARGF